MRFRQTERWIPKEYQVLTQDDAIKAVVYGYDRYAMAFLGNTIKHTFHYTFKNVEHRDKYVADWMTRTQAGQTAQKTMLAERKASRNQANKLKVGDILCWSWGYEQTNVDFFQVLESKGQNVTLQKIASEGVESMPGYSSMSRHISAIKDVFLDGSKPFTKRVQYGDSVKMASYGHCSLWDGKPHYESWYA